MDVPRRLQKRAPLLLQQVDTALLEHELWAAKVAFDAYHIFNTVQINSCEEFLQTQKIKPDHWKSLSRDEQLSAAALGSSYTWRLDKQEYSGAHAWVEKLIWHKQGKLWWPHLIDQMIKLFQISIETLWKPEEEQGVIALLIQLEERYEEYFSGEPFNEKACNQGTHLLDEYVRNAHILQSNDITYPTFIMTQLQELRRHMNRIYAYLIEGMDQTQKIRADFPDPALLPHHTAAQTLLRMIEDNRGNSRFVQNAQEACAFNHVAQSPLKTCDDTLCKKILLWFRSANSARYFRQSQESHALIDEIRAMLKSDKAI